MPKDIVLLQGQVEELQQEVEARDKALSKAFDQVTLTPNP